MWSIAIWIVKNIKHMLQSQTTSILNSIAAGSNIIQIVDNIPQNPSDGVYLIYQNIE